MNASITHIKCLGTNFPIARTSVTQKKCFRIICVIMSGLIVCAFPLPDEKGNSKVTPGGRPQGLKNGSKWDLSRKVEG